MGGGGSAVARVFVSHTSDMAAYPRERSFVQAVLDAVNRAEMVPVDMRYFAARQGRPAGYCQARVRGCDVYVAVVGFRYGSIVPGEAVSYTELELTEATAVGMPRLVFLLDESHVVSSAMADADRGAVDGFRARLRDADLIVRTFTTADGLELEVFHALAELAATVPRRGRCTLPADLSVFVGRDGEIDRIGAAVADTARPGGVVAIHAIDGMPGIGKTALAVHVGHRLAARFPDRQLFIDLHAHTPGHQPVQPGDALADLLAADGVDPRFLPATTDARAALWRDRMADRRLLLVLDNAASTEQVTPLLPGSSESLVLVTSRRHLGDLPAAVPVPLDVLAKPDAVRMFVRLAPRAAAELQTVTRLVRACGRLPLAISIIASLYTRHPAWTGTDLLHELRRSVGGLLTVKAESRTIAAAFDLSYQHLPTDWQRFFRLLGLHPGADIDAYAAAALTGTSLDAAAEHLDGLYHDHLLEEPTYRRYRMHDLIRGYAHTLATTTDPADMRYEAVGRLLDYYQHTAARIGAHLSRYTPAVAATVPPPAAAPQVTGWEQAAAWLRAERPNLLACIHHATAGGQHDRTVALTAGLAALLRIDGPWPQAVELHTAAVTTAHQLGDHHGHVNALHDLRVVRILAGDYLGAADLLGQALDLCRVLGDRRGEATALSELGVVRFLTGDYAGAADLLGQALDLCRVLGDRRGEAYVLGMLGNVRRLTGYYLDAADLLGQALDLCRVLGDRRGEATTFHELGVVRFLTGDYAGAADLLGQALDLCRVLGDRRGEANALNELGVVRRLTGDYPGATDHLQQALGLFRTLGDRRGEAIVLSELGVVRRLAEDHPDAADHLQQALGLHRNLGNRHGEAITRTNLAVVGYLIRDYTGATDLLQQALTVLREVGAPDDEAEALNHLGTVHRLTGQPDQAQALHHQALSIARGIHHRLEEAHALHGIGRAAIDQGDITIARTHLRRALDIYQQLGVPEAIQVTIDLAALDHLLIPDESR